MAIAPEMPEREAQQHTEMDAVALGHIAIGELCQQFSYNDIKEIDAYQLRISNSLGVLVRDPLPVGYQRRHPDQPIDELTDNKHRYNSLVETEIKKDPIITNLRYLYMERGGRLGPNEARVIHLRRTIIACMLHLTGKDRPVEEKG